jgi:cytochrome P450
MLNQRRPHASSRVRSQIRPWNGWIAALRYERRPIEQLERRAKHYDSFVWRSLVAGQMRVVAAPELAHQILHAPGDRYLAGAANTHILPLLPQNTLLTLDGDQHRQRRRQLAPLLGHKRLDASAEQIGALVAGELERWPVGEEFAAMPRLRSLTFRVAATVILGVHEEAEVVRLERGIGAALRPYAMLSGYRALRRLGPASPHAVARRGRQRFADCLSEVMAGRELPFSADEVFTLLLAAQDTTATAIAWALLELAHNPTLAQAMMPRSSGDIEPRWVDAVVHETLRLHPPLVDIARRPTEPVTLAGEVVPAGALLMICPALISHSTLHPNPTRFDPYRILGRRPDPHGWIPFGGGPRRCLGAPLAMLELREVIKQAIERFEMKPARPQVERGRLYGTAVVPAQGCGLILTQRSIPRRVAHDHQPPEPPSQTGRPTQCDERTANPKH